jgi:hypothetical protein
MRQASSALSTALKGADSSIIGGIESAAVAGLIGGIDRTGLAREGGGAASICGPISDGSGVRSTNRPLAGATS